MSGPFVGQIMIFAGNAVPAGFALCDGSLLSVADHAALFDAIGASYGGDGKETFALPDLRGRAPLGQGHGRGLSPYQLGEAVGVEQVRLTVAELPSHNHRLSVVNGPGTTGVPAAGTSLSALGGQAASGEFQTPAYAPSGHQTPLNGATIANTGGGEPHSNIKPYLAFNFCIALTGANP